MDTIDDIVKELYDNAENFGQLSAMFRELAERIDAASKREAGHGDNQ